MELGRILLRCLTLEAHNSSDRQLFTLKVVEENRFDYDYHYFSFLNTDLIIELPRGLQSKINMNDNEDNFESKEHELNLVTTSSSEDDNSHEEEWMSEKILRVFSSSDILRREL